MLTNACKALAKHWLSRDHPTFGAAYILDDKGYARYQDNCQSLRLMTNLILCNQIMTKCIY